MPRSVARSLPYGKAVLFFALGTLTAPGGAGQPKAGPGHPVVPGFARFYSQGSANAAEGGRLLLGELNCLSCHRPDGSAAAPMPRQAPVLDNVGSRIQPAGLRKFLSDPRAHKPGTVMPDVFAGRVAKDKQQRVEELVHFLASTGSLKQARPEKKLVSQGRDLYHKVGCVACHGTRDADGNADKLLATSVPLGDVKAKYTLHSLEAFLANPHTTRPAARMPGLVDAKEAKALANYLLQGAVFETLPPNMIYTYYEGSWDHVPDFDKLRPIASGKVNDFDLSVAKRNHDFAVRFEGHLRIEREAAYRLYLTSDDGSKLVLNDILLIDNDGVHAPMTKMALVRLMPGMHKLVVGMFNAGGPFELNVEIESKGLERQSVSPHVFLTAEGPPKVEVKKKSEPELFTLDPSLAARGRETFATAGCANCHAMRLDGQPIAAKLQAPELSRLQPGGGCLSTTHVKGTPAYSLSPAQRTALAAALKPAAPTVKLIATDLIARTLTTFNCYACHDRDKKGGVEEALNPLFTTAQPEMGDEGRMPPSLDGVGAKLKPAYLKHILANGSHDRPYMHTRMPKFGDANVGHLVSAFAELDKLEPAPRATFKTSSAKVKAEARHLVGGQGLGCIKCHTFAGYKAEGVQGIDMLLLPQRLERDWFHRYVLDPNKFRPGTRMPTAWPEGQTLLPKVLDGDTTAQIEAIWLYLSDGKKAQLPLGLKKQSIPLVPDKHAIVYRNFIEGAGTRAIAVGYPEKAHLAFDANDMRLAIIWQGAFLDASRHWTGRGEGFEGPLGDNVLHLPAGVSFAVLTKPDDPWPTKPAKELGYEFKGYRLTPDQRPTFLYAYADVTIEDFPNAVAGKAAPILYRTLTVTAKQPPTNLWYRAAVANKIELVAKGGPESKSRGVYRIDGEWILRIDGTSEPRIRESAGRRELLVPVRFEGGRAQIGQVYSW